MSTPLLVCRIAWMDHYRGVNVNDVPTGGGTWVKDHGFGHEAFNFEPVRDEYFGYVRATGSGINLPKVGGGTDDEQVGGVTVAWVATHPTEGGIRVVGWYLSATLFGEYQEPPNPSRRRLPDGDAPSFLVRTRKALLLDRDERTFEIPRGKGGMGQSNVWYPDARATAPILRYIESGGRLSSGASRPTKPRLTDVVRRLRIEATAMKKAAAWFVDRSYQVDDVSMDRRGWDLEARLDRAHLKVEVKGTRLGADEFVVEVTPNEYAKMTSAEHQATYRLCVVTSCEESPVVTVFAWSVDTETWASGDGTQHLEIEERLAATIRSTSPATVVAP